MGAVPFPYRSFRVGFLRRFSLGRGRDGSRALFWEDNWLAGCSVKLLAPNLWAAVSPRVRRSRTVQEGLSTGPRGIRWVADITHARTVQVIVQFLSIWDLVRAVRLSPVPNRFV
jgi:hypothetical protein